MKKSTIGTTIAILIVLTAIIGGAVYHTQKNNRFVHSTTATLFFHGGGSSYRAETGMVNAAKKAGVTNTVIRADVTNNGKLPFMVICIVAQLIQLLKLTTKITVSLILISTVNMRLM